MITTEEELKTRLQPYEHANSKPLNWIPSQAIRQAVADVEHVVAAGAVIDMETYGEINGGCSVCLAGAVLLACGHYRKTTHAAMEYRKSFQQDPADAFYIGCAAARRAERESTKIAIVFNQLRLGNYSPLFGACEIRRHDSVVLQRKIRQRWPDCSFTGVLTQADVERLCRTLREIADFLEQEGH